MAFKVGETVVYPAPRSGKNYHAITTRDFQGEQQKFLELQVSQSNLGIMVPESKARRRRRRRRRRSTRLATSSYSASFATLIVEEPANWSRRYKANLEKLASGDVIKVSEVVRDLVAPRTEIVDCRRVKKRMLAKARQILISELALAEKTDEERASEPSRRGPRLLIALCQRSESSLLRPVRREGLDVVIPAGVRRH